MHGKIRDERDTAGLSSLDDEPAVLHFVPG
jgi:hypothetical protein